MRREDRRNQAIYRTLAGFKAEYERAAGKFLASLTEDLLKEKGSLGYYNVNIQYEIESRISEEWAATLKFLINDLNNDLNGEDREFFQFWNKVLWPIQDRTKKEYQTWWQHTWRSINLDFSCPYPAPKQIDLTPQKVSRRNYMMGQFFLKFGGTREDRECCLYAYEHFLMRLEAPRYVNLKDLDLSKHFHDYLPLIRALSRLCDWSRIDDLSIEQQKALMKRASTVFQYYETKKRVEKDGYHYIHKIINRKEETKYHG